ncbi:MAG: DNA-binding protein [Deltaproteobacteria bacterium]|nr:DNA-binding protein [Deltaproteobacteria bacterium]
MGITFSEGHLSKAVTIRVLPGSDVIEGIEEACQNLGIKSGAIISCIGSLQRASVLVAEGPLELLSGQGTIGREEEGEIITVHIHGVVSDKEGHLHGGHLVRGENPVLITCEVMVAQLLKRIMIYFLQKEKKMPKNRMYSNRPL